MNALRYAHNAGFHDDNPRPECPGCNPKDKAAMCRGCGRCPRPRKGACPICGFRESATKKCMHLQDVTLCLTCRPFQDEEDAPDA